MGRGQDRAEGGAPNVEDDSGARSDAAPPAGFASSTITRACKIKRAEDIRDLFVNNFYFGCEADDPLNAYAFNRKANPYGAKMNVLFGSDIGHFDVPDMKDVVPEAYELVEDGLITDDDFRDFMFVNPVRFWGEANPNFFKGTRVEKEAAALLAHERTSA